MPLRDSDHHPYLSERYTPCVHSISSTPPHWQRIACERAQRPWGISFLTLVAATSLHSYCKVEKVPPTVLSAQYRTFHGLQHALAMLADLIIA